MNWQNFSYLIPYLVSFIISMTVAVLIYRQRTVTDARFFSVIAFSQALWTLGYILELVVPTIEAKIFWDDFQWVAAVGWYWGFLVFSVQFSGWNFKKPKLIWTFLSLIPIMFLLLVITNQYTHLIRDNAWLIPGEPFSVLEYDFTAVVWFFSIIFYLFFLVGLYFLAKKLVQSPKIQKAQLWIILIGTIVPLAGTILTLMEIRLGFDRENTPLSFAISNLLVLYGLTRFRLFNIQPIASKFVIENMVDPVIVLDPENQIVDQNPAARDLTKAPIHESHGRPAADVFAAWPELVEKIQGPEQFLGEIMIGTGEGNRKKEYKVFISPLRSRTGIRQGSVILAKEITALDIIEDALREEEEKYRRLVEITLDWVWMIDKEGDLTFSNQAIERLLGYSVDEILRKPVFSLMTPDRQAEIKEMVAKAVEEKTGWKDLSIRWRHKDGHYRVFESSSQPILDTSGNVTGFSGIDRDITERFEMEEMLRQSKQELEKLVIERTDELHQSEENYRSVVETANESIFVINGEKIVFVNPKATEITGYSQQELLEIPWIDLVHIEDKAEVNEEAERYLTPEDELIGIGVFRLVNKEGETRWVESKTDLIVWEEETAILAIVSDVTEKVLAEEVMRSYTEQLNILREIDQVILEAQSLEEISRTILGVLHKAVPYNAAGISLYDFKEDHVIPLGRVVPDSQSVDNELLVGSQIDDQEIIDFLIQGETLHISSGSKSSQHKALGKKLFPGLRTESVLVVPIMIDDDLRGKLEMSGSELDTFDSRHIELAEQVASLLAVALRQNRLFEAEQQARRTAETMQTANLALTKTLDLDVVLDTLLSVIAELVPFDSANLFLYEEEKYLVSRASSGYVSIKKGNFLEISSFEADRVPLLSKIINTHESVVVPDISSYPDWASVPETGHINSWIGVPLISGGEIIGILTLNHLEPNFYNDEHKMLAESLALQATIAIQNANLFEQTIQRAGELEDIMEISSALRLATQQDEMFSILLEKAKSSLRSDAGAVFLLDHSSMKLSGVYGPKHTADNITQHEPTMELIGEVAQSAEPLFLAEQPIDSRYEEDKNSLALLPMKTSEGIIGVMLFAWVETEEFSAATRRLLNVFVDLVGNTLERTMILETLEQQVANRTRDLSVLYQVTSVVSAYRDLGSITKNALEEILLAVNANLGTIHFRSPEETNFHLVSQHGIPEKLLDDLNLLPIGGQFIGGIIENDEPLVIMDFKHDPRVPEALLLLDCQVYIGTPIRIRGQIQGVLSVYLETPAQYNTDNVRLLMMVVDQLGIALERAQLQEQAEEAVVMEERQRLARELHDAVTQSLYSLSLMADAARKFNDQTMWARSEHYLRMVQDTAKEVLKEMRLLVFELRPTALEEEGFVNALRQRLETVEARARVETSFDVEEIVAPRIDIQVALYRIAQEALNNALKHSQATSMTVQYYSDKDRISLSITDDGHGFDPNQASGGIGMRSMRERTEKLGGEFSVVSNQDEGTSINVRIEEMEKWTKP